MIISEGMQQMEWEMLTMKDATIQKVIDSKWVGMIADLKDPLSVIFKRDGIGVETPPEEFWAYMERFFGTAPKILISNYVNYPPFQSLQDDENIRYSADFAVGKSGFYKICIEFWKNGKICVLKASNIFRFEYSTAKEPLYGRNACLDPTNIYDIFMDFPYHLRHFLVERIGTDLMYEDVCRMIANGMIAVYTVDHFIEEYQKRYPEKLTDKAAVAIFRKQLIAGTDVINETGTMRRLSGVYRGYDYVFIIDTDGGMDLYPADYLTMDQFRRKIGQF